MIPGFIDENTINTESRLYLQHNTNKLFSSCSCACIGPTNNPRPTCLDCPPEHCIIDVNNCLPSDGGTCICYCR